MIESFIKKNKRYPTLADLEAMGITRAMLRTEYGSLYGLKEAFSHLPEIYDLERSDVVSINRNVKKYIFTTAVTDSSVHLGFLANMRAYCSKNKAQLVIIPSQLTSKNGWVLDPVLKNETIILKDTALNNNLFVLGIKNSAAKVDPVSGLPRVGKRNGTFICASPKQRLKYVATGVNKLPHALMSTGACTLPNYLKSSVLVDKTSYIADYDHVIGAVIVELDEDNTFHFRQIQADKNGTFCDLGKQWKNGKESKTEATLILGDYHTGSIPPELREATINLSDTIGIKRWVLHDLFDGASINHHEKQKLILLAGKADAGELSLEKELITYSREIESLSKGRELVIVRSNHDEFLDLYLNEGDYVKHPYNLRVALHLSLHKLEGSNPLEAFYKEMYRGKRVENIRWLSIDESYKIGGVELAKHGHKGSNGARGSITSMESAYGDVIFGHSHTPEILRKAVCVGTSTHLQLEYNKAGASSWMQTHCLLYNNGQRQLINFVNGKFSLDL